MTSCEWPRSAPWPPAVRSSRGLKPARTARWGASSYAVGYPRQAKRPPSLHWITVPFNSVQRLSARELIRAENRGLVFCLELEVRVGLEQVAPTDQDCDLTPLGLSRATSLRTASARRTRVSPDLKNDHGQALALEVPPAATPREHREPTP